MRGKVVAVVVMGIAGCGAVADRASEDGVHEVRMMLSEDGSYVYEPARLSIQKGDRVRWINVSGWPHNVAFRPGGIPDGAAPVLDAAMADRMADLTGPLLLRANAVYEVSFADAPAGTYDYFCTPHQMLGMTAQLTVTD